ncbi:MAG: BadF/BadG/BcrA/BcrD ATPase family protein [Candidatus Hinthialibacter sp.]
MPYIFGIDGGGTQSRAVLMTDFGKVVYVGKGPALNYHYVGASQVSSSVKRLFNEALQNARARPDECRGVCLGLAGAGQEKDQAILQPLFDELFGGERCLLLSDAEIALISGALAETGIIVLAGTGSMIYGRNKDGLDGRIGGYGPTLSDEGSGYHIGLEGLKAIAWRHDGLLEEVGFQQSIFEYMGFHQVSDMIDWINSNASSREQIAALAEILVRAASEDDPLAEEILNRQAEYLARFIDALHRRLSFPESVDIVLSGGLFSDASYYWQLVRRKIHYYLPGANIISPRMEPVMGAAIYALSMANIDIDENLLDLAQRTYRECRAAKSSAPKAPPSGDPPPRSASAGLTDAV